MSSAVAEVDNYLQSMLALKPPGVSGSKINSITSLCVANVQDESVLIQKIYTHFKKAPGTHKLGVLYVVDSVTRQWVEAARRAGQPSGGAAPDGTFAAGVNRVTELLPVLMTDIINNAPENQKEKIRKLVDIWERGYTFPPPMIASFKDKLNAPASQNVASTTPEGSPAPNFNPLTGTQQQPQGSNGTGSAAPGQPAPDTSSILKALADMAKQNTAASAAPPVTAQPNPLSALAQQTTPPQTVPTSVEQTSQPAGGQAAANPFAGGMPGPFAALGNMAQNPALMQPQSQSHTPNTLSAPQNPLATLLPQATAPAPAQPAPAMGTDPLQQQFQLLQMLAAQGIPQEQWGTALQILSLSNANMTNANPGQAANYANLPGQIASAWGGGRPDSQPRDDRDRDYMRSPPGQYRRRSRSPGWDRRRDMTPPRRRDSPIYGEYRGDSPGRRGGDPRDTRGRRVNDYRHRSPPGRRRRSPSPSRKDPNLPPPGPKLIEWDYSIGQGHIKVLSRTLFVGGVTSSEAHLRSLFNRFGLVQTCIVNTDKRHAFIKMITRNDAINARDGMESYRTGEMQLRTRWGVGFGPRDCSDYQTGVSIIPIERLTEADRKWMLTAEYGGSGGRPIETGMVVEEPDIEIGAGVSSKAISRRIATDTGGRRGPVSSRTQQDRVPPRPEREGPGRPGPGPGGPGNQAERDAPNSNVGVPPAVPGFGFSFPGMPMLPPGFMMGGAQSGSAQPPPPPGQGS